jgi:hypothetical protein
VTTRWTVIGGSVVGAVALIGGAYALGRTNAADRGDAAREQADAYTQAYDEGFSSALMSARQRGLEAGHAEGAVSGQRACANSGEGDAQSDLAASSPAPGTPGSTVCVTYQDYIPGVGCYPPVAPGQTEAPINCPPGQVPVGTTGACARP